MSSVRKLAPGPARAGFRPGVYRDQDGSLYLATGLVRDPQGDEQVVYRALAGGGHRCMPLTTETDAPAWSDHVLWPSTQTGAPDRWPNGQWAPRYLACDDIRYLFLVVGHDDACRSRVIQAAREYQQVEVDRLDNDLDGTRGILAQVTTIPVIVLLAQDSKKGTVPDPAARRDKLTGYDRPDRGIVPIEVGPDYNYVLGQIRGILALLGTREVSDGG